MGSTARDGGRGEAPSRDLPRCTRGGIQVLITEAERVRRKAELGGSATLMEQLGKLEREFRAERRRDYFRSPLRAEAAAALRAARLAVRGMDQSARARGAESNR